MVNLNDNMQMNLTLNPAVRLSIVSSESLQFRFPDYGHITIACDPQLMATILSDKQPKSAEDWETTFVTEKLCHDANVAKELLQSLVGINVLVNFNQDITTRGQSILMHEHLKTKQLKTAFATPTISKVGIAGEGIIADIIKQAVSNISELNCADTGDSDYIIVVSDLPNISKLREMYKSVGKSEYKSAMWLDDGSFRNGPLHVKGESACLECFVARSRASTNFFAEVTANHESFYEGTNLLPLGSMEQSLIAYAIERHLRLLMQGQFDLIVPGQLETWDILSGEKEVGMILRNPYCDCIDNAANPTRTIRDI